MRILVIGLGNPILGDDGVGLRVAEELEKEIAGLQSPHEINVEYDAGGGLRLMERLVDYDHGIVIDALDLGRGPEGTVYQMELDELPNPSIGHLGSAHETNLQVALKLGHDLKAHLPNRVTIVGIETKNVSDFSETLSPAIEAAVPQAAQTVIQLLKQLE
jgi:hydrogenase maturation protease